MKNRLDYLKKCKALWRSIIAQRKYLLANFKGHVNSDWATEKLKNLEHATAEIDTAQRAKAYLLKEETALRFLIPANNKKRHDELRELLETNLN